MMSLSWEFLCEMNFNLKVFTQREEAKNCSLLYLIWKVRGKIILHHYRSISQIQLSFHFTFCSAKQTYLIFILFFPENHCNGFVWAAVTGNQTHYISQDKVNAKMILIIYGYASRTKVLGKQHIIPTGVAMETHAMKLLAHSFGADLDA